MRLNVLTLTWVAGATLTVVAGPSTKMPEPAKFKISFEKDVQPILAAKCYSCHSREVQQSGLRLDARQNALRGGDYGPAILGGNSAHSHLIKTLGKRNRRLQMAPSA